MKSAQFNGAPFPMEKTGNRLRILVSSTVYGIEELLEQVYSLLNGFEYEVWCSHKGTMTVYPNKTAFESCLQAVEECDLFLSIITPHYGSGMVGGGISITHQELLKAISMEKPRWILAHDHISFARSLFMKLGYKNGKQRAAFLRSLGYKTGRKLANLAKREQSVIDDFRVLDMYDAAIRYDLNVYQDRKGNWVQKFTSADDARLFATAQFIRYKQVEQFLRETFEDQGAIRARIQQKGKI